MRAASVATGTVDMAEILTRSFPVASAAIGDLVGAFKDGASASQIMGTAVSGLWSILSAHPILAVAGAVTGLVALFDKFTTTADEATANMNDSMSAYETSKQSVADINSELDQTKQSIDELNAKEGLTFVEEEELSKLREARDLLELQKDVAEREELRAGKEMAKETAKAYKKNFVTPINEEETKQYYDSIKGTTQYPSLLLEDKGNVSGMIAAIKLMKDLRKQVKSEGGDWSELDSAINTATDTILTDQVKKLTQYKENLEAIPYEELTTDQQALLDTINQSIDYIYKELDPGKFKQMQFDKIFDNQSFAQMKQDLVELAKESNNAGIQMSDIPESLKTAVENAGFTVDDLINNINSEAGLIDFKKFAKQIKKNFKSDFKDANPEGLVLKPEVEVEPEIENLDVLKDRYLTFSDWWDGLSNKEKKEQIKLNPSLDIDVDAADFDMSEATKKVKEKYKDALGLGDFDIAEEVTSEFNGWVKELSNEDLQLLYNATVEGGVDVTGWDLTDWQNALDDARQQMEDMGDAEFSEEMTFSSFLESAVNPEDEDSDTVNEFVDNFQEKVSTIQEALNTLRSGEKVDLTDLVQELNAPELLSRTDNLEQGLVELRAKLTSEFASMYQDISRQLSGEEQDMAQDFLRNLITSFEWTSGDIDAFNGLGRTVGQMLSENLNSNEMEIVQAYQDAVDAKNARIERFVGNVDVNHRPVRLNEDGSHSTVESETFNFSDFGLDKEGAFNVTPILPNGETIENLEDYIQSIVDSGGNIEDSNIFLGAYENIDAAVDAAVALHEEQETMYADEAQALAEIQSLAQEHGWNFITPEAEDQMNWLVSMIEEASQLKPLPELIKSEETTNRVSEYQSEMENLMTVRQKLSDSKGELDTADLQEALELCPDLINYLDDLDGGIDELSATANDDILGYFTDQIDALREAGRNADADALQEYVDMIIENANTIEQTFIRIGNMKIPAPDLEEYREALETENQGATYDEMYSGLEKAKELYEKGLTGTDDFKTFAALISPTGSDDPVNFLENLGKAERYLTEDSSGLQNFMSDMEQLGYATQDGEQWSWDLGNGLDGLQEAADRAGISLSFMLSMFGKAEEYGAYNDFFTTEEEGADKLDELYTDLAAEKRRLAEIEANPNTEGYETAVEESKAKIAEYEERIESLKTDLEEFGTYTPEAAAERAEQAIQVAKDLQSEIDSTSDETYKSHLQEELDSLMQEYHLTLDVDGNFESLEESAADLDLEINFEAGSNSIEGEIGKVSEYIAGMENGSIDFDTSKLEEAQQLLTYLLERKQELEEPAVMEIDDSQLSNVDADVANAIVSIQQLQSAYDAMEVILGQNEGGMSIDTSEAQAQLDAAVAKVKELDTATQEELGLHITADMTNEEIIDQIKNMDLSQFDEVHSLQYRFDIQNKEEFDQVIADLDKLPTDAKSVVVSIDTSQVNQEQLNAIKTSLSEFQQSHPTTNVTLEGVPQAKQEADEVIAKMHTLDNSDARPTVSVNNQASGTIAMVQSELNSLANRAPVTVSIITERTTVNKTVNEGSTGGGTVTGRNNHFKINTTQKLSGAARATGDSKIYRKTNKKNKTLVGEVGREMVVDPQTNEWHTVGDNGPEITEIPDNAIVFNHKQTEDLLNKGRTKERGKAMLKGNAANTGKGFPVTQTVTEEKKTTETTIGGTGNRGGGGGNKGGSGDSGSSGKSKDKESFDWIEIALSRLERAVENFAKTVDDIYSTFSDRNAALTSEIQAVTNEYNVQNQAAQRYYQEFARVAKEGKFSSAVINGIKNGTINIAQYSNDAASAIKEAQEWYEKFLECTDTATDLATQLKELSDEKWELRLTEWEGSRDELQYKQDRTDSRINRRNESASDYKNTRRDTRAAKRNIKDYRGEQKVNSQQIDITQKAYTDAKAQFDKDVADKTIVKGTEAYNKRLQDLNDMADALGEFHDKEIELANDICEETVRIFENALQKFENKLNKYDFKKDQIESDIALRNEKNSNNSFAKQVKASKKNVKSYKKEQNITDKEIDTLDDEIKLAEKKRRKNLKKGSKNDGWDKGSKQDQEALERIRDLKSEKNQKKLEKEERKNAISEEYVKMFENTLSKFDRKLENREFKKDQIGNDIELRNEKNRYHDYDDTIGASRQNMKDYKQQNKITKKEMGITKQEIKQAEKTYNQNIKNGVWGKNSKEARDAQDRIRELYEQQDAQALELAEGVNAITEEAINIFDTTKEKLEANRMQLEHSMEMTEGNISRRTAAASSAKAIDESIEASRGNIADYRGLIKQNEADLAELEHGQQELIERRQEAIDNGMELGGADDVAMLKDINDYDNLISDAKDRAIEYANSITDEIMNIFEATVEQFENRISGLQHIADRLEAGISMRTAFMESDYVEMGKANEAERQNRVDYNSAIVDDQLQVKARQAELADVRAKMQDALNNGFDENSRDYQSMREKERDILNEIDSLNADIIDQSNKISETYVNIFNNIASEYENKLSMIEHMANLVNGSLDQADAKGRLASEQYYKDLLELEQQSKTMLEQQKADMESAFYEGLASGEIEVGSRAYYEMQQAINGVTEQLQQADTAMIQFENEIRQANWDNFDYLEERISRITDEADFLIDLMSASGEDMVDENGAFTDKGLATVGLHAVNYDTYMSQADDYAEEIKKINEEIAKDPANKDLIARKEELIDAQQDSILAAEREKQAMIDLAKEGIDEAINHMSDLIDKYKDALQACKDLYDYANSVADQAKNIASLEKQLSAYENDTSEEAKATVQKLKVELEEAQQDLKDTEFDHYISEQERLLDNLRDEFEETLNRRMDDVDALFLDMIKTTNDNSGTIRSTIETEASNVGYDITTEMDTIWNSASPVVTAYYNGFNTRMDGTNTAIGNLHSKVEEMKTAADTEALAAKTWRETEASNQRAAELQAHEDAAANGQSTKDYGQAIVDQVNASSTTLADQLQGEGKKTLTDLDKQIGDLKNADGEKLGSIDVSLGTVKSAVDAVKDAVGQAAKDITEKLGTLDTNPDITTGLEQGGGTPPTSSGGDSGGGSNSGDKSKDKNKDKNNDKNKDKNSKKNDKIISDIFTILMKKGKEHVNALSKDEKEQHSNLWKYIVLNYGYAPTNEIYRQIADMLGIKVGGSGKEDIPVEKKDKILEALKKIGFAKGLRRAKHDRVAWVDEKGQEVILRPSENAILTDIKKDDTILNADATENLWKLTTDPAAFIGKYSIGDVAIKEASGATASSSDSSTINMGDYAFTINLPNVTNYEQFRAQFMKDKMMEQYLCSVTVDPMLGKNKSAKYRFNP